MRKLYLLALLTAAAVCMAISLASCASGTSAAYSVTFVVDGETAEKISVGYPYIVEAPDIEVAEGYNLSCWYKNTEYTESFDFTQKIEGDLTLYAYLIADCDMVYKVTYLLDGVLYKEADVKYGQCAPEIELAEDELYYYSEWYCAGEPFDFSSPITCDTELRAVGYAKVYYISFYADGALVQTAAYSADSYSIAEPAVPAKQYYSGEWEAYELSYGDISVNAVYTPVTYTASFIVEGELYDETTYNVLDGADKFPSVPQKAGYYGEWSEIPCGGDVTVYAVYTPIEYTVTFVCDGITVATCTYTVENTDISYPELPAREGYTVYWDEIEFDLTDKTVYAHYVYTGEDEADDSEGLSDDPQLYTATFIAEGETVDVIYYYAGQEFEAPDVPPKTGYDGVWADFTPDGDITVEAVYTPISYTVTFIADGDVVKRVSFTIEDMSIEEPEVPKKTGYTGVWESYELILDNVTVYAVYTSTFDTAKLIYSDGQITGYSGTAETVVIPSLIDGQAVTAIGDSAFKQNTNIKYLIIEEGIESIGNYSFQFCTSLVYVSLPEGLKSIGARAFSGCNSIIEINLPNSIEIISDYAFNECSSLKTITIPANCTVVGAYSFQYCTSLESVILCNGVLSIETKAFQYCNSLSYINLGNTLKSIGERAFYINSSSENVLTSLYIPATVTYIAKSAFSYRTALTEVIFEICEGWKLYNSSGEYYGELSSADLSNAQTAAQYLTTDKTEYIWKLEVE